MLFNADFGVIKYLFTSWCF